MEELETRLTKETSLRSDVLLRARPKNDMVQRVNCYIVSKKITQTQVRVIFLYLPNIKSFVIFSNSVRLVHWSPTATCSRHPELECKIESIALCIKLIVAV